MRGVLAATALLTAASVGLGGASGAQAAPYLDPAAWQNAVLDLDATLRPQGKTVRYVPFTVRPLEYEDGYGVFRDGVSRRIFLTYSSYRPDEGAWYEGPGSGTFRMLDGTLHGSLGCISTYYPCLGATRVTFGFDRAVLGFGGDLRWNLTSAYDYYNSLPDILPFFAATHERVGVVFDPSKGYIGDGYDGFFGIVEPMTSFDLAFHHGDGLDTYVFVRFSGLMLVAVPVPEPPALPLLAAALAALGLAGTRRVLSPSAGSR